MILTAETLQPLADLLNELGEAYGRVVLDYVPGEQLRVVVEGFDRKPAQALISEQACKAGGVSTDLLIVALDGVLNQKLTGEEFK